jgi:outer membrane protein TolC
MTMRTARPWHLLLAAAILGAAGPLPASGEEQLTLDRAIALARERNPSLRIEAERIKEAEADYRAARASLFPHLSASGYQNRLDPGRLSPGGTGVAVPLFGRESFAGLSARQLLYDGSSRHRGDAAGAAVAAQQAAYLASLADTALQVSQAFFRVLEARALEQTADDALGRQRGFEALSRGLFDAGKVTQLDLLKARSDRLEAEAAVLRAKELEVVARALLGATIGLDVPDFAVLGDLAAPSEPPPDEQMALATAATRNPDLERLARQVAQAELSLRAARGGRAPAIGVQGGYGYRERDLGGGADEWTAGVVVELPIFDGGAVGAGIAKAESVLAQRREAERSARLQIEAEVREGLSDWRRAIADAFAADERVTTGRESTRAAEALYRAGKATALDVLTAQADLTRAEGDQAQARAAYALARAQVGRLLGNPAEVGR